MLRRLIWRCLSGSTLIVLIFAGALGAAPNSAKGGIPNLPLSRPFETPWTLADFDGDHNPDLAQAISRDSGTVYRIDIGLSRGPSGSFMIDNPDAWDLDLDAVDVDGDRDVDLIVNERFRKQRIKVFINDGQGSFSTTSSSLSSETFERTTFTPAVPNGANQAFDNKPPRRLDGGLVRCGVIAPQPREISATTYVSLILIFDPGRGPQHVRAPPAV